MKPYDEIEASIPKAAEEVHYARMGRPARTTVMLREADERGARSMLQHIRERDDEIARLVAEARLDKTVLLQLQRAQKASDALKDAEIARLREALERVWREVCSEYPEGQLRDQHRWIEQALKPADAGEVKK